MKNKKLSSAQKFMYSVIAIMIVISSICFIYNYLICNNDIILTIGITAFTILYHFAVRIILNNIANLFKDNFKYSQKFFMERKHEKKLYKLLKVKDWKDKMPTFVPDTFSLENHSMEEIANTMCMSEVNHILNIAISLSTILFSLIWGMFGVFFATAILASLFDSLFIIMQRYNRPRFVKLMERKNREKEKILENSIS